MHFSAVDIELVVNMCGRITELWETKQHTDVTLLVQGSRIPAHRIILASQSDYFDRLLYGDMREASQDEIQLHDVESLKAFQMLMQYIYSGRLKIQNCSTTVYLATIRYSYCAQVQHT